MAGGPARLLGARAAGLAASAVGERRSAGQDPREAAAVGGLARAPRLSGRHPLAAQGVALLDESARLAAGLVDAPRGVLRVTASVTFGKLCLAPLIPEFLARYPEIDLQLTLLDRIVDLVDEGYDVALRLTRSPPDQVVAKALMPVRYRLCSTVNGKKWPILKTRSLRWRTPTCRDSRYLKRRSIVAFWLPNGSGGVTMRDSAAATS